MRGRPLVSVVTTFLNAEKFMREAIESVFAQSYDNWELLLVDDGSTDGSTEIARQYAERNSGKVRYLEHAGHRNLGMSASRNRGIGNAGGEYIGLLDADDVWLPRKLEQQVTTLTSQPEAGLVYGLPYYWYSWTGHPEDSERDFVPELGMPSDVLVRPPTPLLRSYPLGKALAPCPSGLLLRRELVERVGGFEESFRGIHQLYEDSAFLAKVYLEAPVFISSERWIKYRIHPDSCGSVVTRAGQYHTVRLFFLRWFESYLSGQGIRDAEVSKVLENALWPYRDPILLTATPNPLPADWDTTTIAWSTGDGSVGQVWVARDGGPEELFGEAPTGARTVPSIGAGSTGEFRLYAGTARATQLDTVRVARMVAAASTDPELVSRLAATPNPVPAGSDATITWSTADGSVGQVWVAQDGRPEELLAEGAGGAQAVAWIGAGSTYEFRLYAGTARATLLDTVTVTRAVSATSGATAPSPPEAIAVASPPAAPSPRPLALRQAARWLRNRFAPKALILVYHRVADPPSDPWTLCVAPRHFAEHLEILRRQARVMRLQELVCALQDGNLPRRAVVVTLDDGYADNLHSAKPLLERYDVPATVFLTTGYLGQEREFWWDELDRLLLQPGRLPEALHLSVNGWACRWELGEASQYSPEEARRHRGWTAAEDAPSARHVVYRSLWQLLQRASEDERRKALDDLAAWAGAPALARPSHRPLRLDEVAALAQGNLLDIGAHTVTHSVLAALPAASQRDEIRRSRTGLEELLDRPVTSFAYPYGRRSDYTPETVALVREAGFACACAVAFDQAVGRGSDLFQLPRVPVQDWDGEELAGRLSTWFEG